jgi:hypothetical protein
MVDLEAKRAKGQTQGKLAEECSDVNQKLSDEIQESGKQTLESVEKLVEGSVKTTKQASNN